MITFSEDEPVQIKAILVNNITSKKFRHLKRPHARRVIDELRECHLGENERRSANESPSLRATYQLFLSCFFYLLHIRSVCSGGGLQVSVDRKRARWQHFPSIQTLCHMPLLSAMSTDVCRVAPCRPSPSSHEGVCAD